MKQLLYVLLLLSTASCAALKEEQQARKVARAQAVLKQYEADTPPDQQLSDLLARNPQLEGQRVRVVTQTDTIRLPAHTVTVRIPAESTPASDNALIDSLIRSAAAQLHTKDSTAYAARLRAILAARPKLRRDTLVQALGPLTVRTWVDAQGVPHTTVASKAQKIAFEKTVHENGPVLVQHEATLLERIILFFKNAAGLIIGFVIVAGLAWLFFFLKRQRDKPTTA